MKTVLIHLFLVIAAILAPVKLILIAITCLTIVDLISGVAASIKQKVPITSSGFKRTLIKIAVYQFVVIMGFLSEKYIIGDLIPVVKIFSSLIGITELKSVLENVELITGIPVIQMIIDKLGSKQDGI